MSHINDTALNRKIQEKGYTISDFAENVLGMKYPTYRMAIKHKTLRLRDVERICMVLECSFEDVFPRQGWMKEPD